MELEGLTHGSLTVTAYETRFLSLSRSWMMENETWRCDKLLRDEIRNSVIGDLRGAGRDGAAEQDESTAFHPVSQQQQKRPRHISRAFEVDGESSVS